MFDWILDPGIWISLFTLSILEIVLGIDNIIFISITASKLPFHQQASARTLGLMMALVTRLMLLASLFWLSKLTKPFFYILEHGVSGRDIVLLLGGLFLIYKSVQEIHEDMEGVEKERAEVKKAAFGIIIAQIAILDIVFSLDSVLTAVGMTDQFYVMAAAIFIAIGIMLFAAAAVSNFIVKHPTVKMLALCFLLLIGMTLIADSLHFHIPRGYLYFAVSFAVFVEALNIFAHKKREKHEELKDS